MSTLTTTRRGASDGDIHNIVSLVNGLRIEGVDAAAVISALYDALDGSGYQQFGSVDLDDVAGRIRQETKDYDHAEAEFCRLEDMATAWDSRPERPLHPAFSGVMQQVNALTIRG